MAEKEGYKIVRKPHPKGLTYYVCKYCGVAYNAEWQVKKHLEQCLQKEKEG